MIAAVDAARIPAALRRLDRWIVWRAGEPKPNGKFEKIPIDPATGHPISAHDQRRWLAFENAIAAHRNGAASGVGLVMSPNPIVVHNEAFHLVGLDFDDCAGDAAEIKRIGHDLCWPYAEVSPSGKGLRMFVLSRTPLTNVRAERRELYAGRQFLTVTGHGAKGTLHDATDALTKLHANWTAGRSPLKRIDAQTTTISTPSFPDSEANVARVESALAALSSDCPYDRWRNLVWAVLATRWGCAKKLARDWSAREPHRFDEGGFDAIVASFKPDGGIGVGTLFHHAREAGWVDTSEPAAAIAPTRLRRRLLTANDIRALAPTSYRVHGLLPARGLAAIFGEPGCGKSFLSLDLAFSIASGRLWFGQRTKAAPVIYAALEGQGGLNKRLAAWEKHNSAKVSGNLRFIDHDFALMDEEAIAQWASEIVGELGTGGVVFVDTLNQSAPGADENASGDMGRIIAGCKRLAEAVDGVVVLVHHCGKDAARGLRGHSSLNAALDVAMEVRGKSGMRTWRVTKAKDDDAGGDRGFELVGQQLGSDADGEPITSCAVQPCLGHVGATAPPRPATGKRQMQALAVLAPLLARGGLTVDAAVSAVVVTLSDLEPRRQRSTAKELVKKLKHGGQLTGLIDTASSDGGASPFRA